MLGQSASKMFKSLSRRLFLTLLLVFNVTPLAQNKNQNRSINPVLRKKRRLIYKDSRQDSGHSHFPQARYAEKCFTQTYSDFYGDIMLVPIQMGSNMAARNQQKHLLLSFATKAQIIP